MSRNMASVSAFSARGLFNLIKPSAKRPALVSEKTTLSDGLVEGLIINMLSDDGTKMSMVDVEWTLIGRFAADFDRHEFLVVQIAA